jgi:uncharacterized membrane protein
MPEPASKTKAQVVVPRWVPWAACVIVVLGIVDATWLTIAHYTTPATLSCPDTGIINCAKVTTSVFSEILGIPVAVLGLIFFVGMLPFQLPVAWRSANPWIRRLRLLGASTGVLMVFWLIYVELFRLNAICLFCTAAHILTICLFGVTIVGVALSETVEAH